MNGKTKKEVIALLSGAAALCLGGVLVCGTSATKASAAVAYEAFVNVGATETASATDALLGLTEKNAAATAAGTVTGGNTLFGSYSTGAEYKMTVSAVGTYQISVALKAEEGKTLTVAGENVSLAEKSGNCVITLEKQLAGTEVSVGYDGALCGVLVSAAGAKTLMTADYTPGQVVSYGALLADQLEDATAYYSDGTTAELPIAYGDINAWHRGVLERAYGGCV